MKFKQVEGNYENLIKLFEAPAIISEEEGYEAFQVNFLLYSREQEVQQRKRGSCFELLRRLVKNSNSAMPLNKDTLVTILTRYHYLFLYSVSATLYIYIGIHNYWKI